MFSVRYELTHFMYCRLILVYKVVIAVSEIIVLHFVSRNTLCCEIQEFRSVSAGGKCTYH